MIANHVRLIIFQISWYTKRALLNKIYIAKEPYLLQDDSALNEATWEFLERRIDNVSEMGRIMNQNSNFS